MNRLSISGDVDDQKSPFIIKARFYSVLSKISIKMNRLIFFESTLVETHQTLSSIIYIKMREI